MEKREYSGLAYAALFTALAALTAYGVHKADNTMKNPKYQALVKQAAQTPGTNVYKAMHNK